MLPNIFIFNNLSENKKNYLLKKKLNDLFLYNYIMKINMNVEKT